MRLYRSEKRLLKEPEKHLLERLLQQVENNEALKKQLADAQVREMEDGGMGSLYFLHPEKADTERRFGKRVAELQFKDIDGVDILAALNVDSDGGIMELDIWKTDYSPTVKLEVP
jgi:hypothetical protein